MKISCHCADSKKSLFKRESPVVPCRGDVLVRHTDEGTKHYEVLRVFHVYEEREWYKNKLDMVVDVALEVREVERG